MDLPENLVQQFTDCIQTAEFRNFLREFSTRSWTFLCDEVARTSPIGSTNIDAFSAWYDKRILAEVDAALHFRISIPAAANVGTQIDKLNINMKPKDLAEFEKFMNRGKPTIALGEWRDEGNTVRRIRLRTDVEGLNFTYLTFSDKEDDSIFKEAETDDPRFGGDYFDPSTAIVAKTVYLWDARPSKPAASPQSQRSYPPRFQQSRYYGRNALSVASAGSSRVSWKGMAAIERAGFDPQFNRDDRSMYSSSPAPTEAISVRSDETPIASPLMVPADLKVAKHLRAQLDPKADIVRTKFPESIGSNILERFLPLGQLEIITSDPTTNKSTSKMSPWCLVVNLDDLRPWIVLNVEALKEGYTTYLTPGNRLATWCDYPLPFSHGRVEFPNMMGDPEQPMPPQFWENLFQGGGSFQRTMVIGTVLQYNCFAIGELVWDEDREQYVRPLTSNDFPPVDRKGVNAQAGSMRLGEEDVDDYLFAEVGLLDIYNRTATMEYQGV